MTRLKRYLRRVTVAFDQALNVVLGGLPDETISARLGRAAGAGKWWGRAGRAALDYLAPGHCAGAERHDEARAERVEATERRALGESQTEREALGEEEARGDGV